MSWFTFIFFVLFGLFSIVTSYGIRSDIMLGKIDESTSTGLGLVCLRVIVIASTVSSRGTVNALIPTGLGLAGAIGWARQAELGAYLF